MKLGSRSDLFFKFLNGMNDTDAAAFLQPLQPYVRAGQRSPRFPSTDP
jgi:hypothetical protein